MADVLIKGMEMPTCCGKCPLIDYETLECRCGGIRDKNCYCGIYDGCPLVPVPPNGELIEKGYIIGGLKAARSLVTDETGLDLMERHIQNAPTIIAASEDADVVEVVRCKDCTRLVQKNGKLWCGGSAVLPFHYCSFGKRRTDDKEAENELDWKTYTNKTSSAGLSITVNEWKDAD